MKQKLVAYDNAKNAPGAKRAKSNDVVLAFTKRGFYDSEDGIQWDQSKVTIGKKRKLA